MVGAVATGNAFFYFGTQDPTITATAAPVGSWYFLTTTGIAYRKTGAGNTAWSIVGLVYSPPEKWAQDPVTASQINVVLSALVSISFDTIKMIRAGSIVGLSTRLTDAVSAGTATVKATINGVASTLSVVSTNASNQSGGQSAQAPGIDTYVAGDELGMQITTDGSFAPITTNLEGWMQLFE